MAVLDNPKRYLLVFFDLVCLVILGKPFVEPRRDVRLSDARVEHEMRVLVKDRAESVFGFALGRERDVIYIVARLKITRDTVVRLSVRPFRFERPVSRSVLENDHGRRRGTCDLHSGKKQPKRFAKLFEPGRNGTNVLFGRVADEMKILGSDADPNVRGRGNRNFANR